MTGIIFFKFDYSKWSEIAYTFRFVIFNLYYEVDVQNSDSRMIEGDCYYITKYTHIYMGKLIYISQVGASFLCSLIEFKIWLYVLTNTTKTILYFLKLIN